MQPLALFSGNLFVVKTGMRALAGKYGCLTSVEAEPEGPTTDLPPVQKAIDAQWERLRAMELRPDVQALFTPDRERCCHD